MKVISPIFSDFQGELGDASAFSWKGKKVLRTKKLSRNDAKTQAQLEQRAKFKVAVHWLKPYLGFVRTSFHSEAIDRTEYNCSMSQLLREAITGNYPNYTIDPSKVIVSKGSLSKLQGSSATSTTSGIRLSWSDTSLYDDNANSTDIVMFLFYNVDKSEVYYQTTSEATRAEQTLSVTTPNSWSGDSIHVYIACRTDVGLSTEVSDSAYLGELRAL